MKGYSTTPLIKPSHKGLLHEDLGVPKGEKIPHEMLEGAKHSKSAAVRKRANFALNFNDGGHHGTVCAISSDYGNGNGKFARISVKHGAAPKRKKSGKNEAMAYDDRPESTVYVPKAHAGRYHIGQKVGVGLAALPDGEPADGDDSYDGSHEDAMEDYHRTQRSIMTGKRRPS